MKITTYQGGITLCVCALALVSCSSMLYATEGVGNMAVGGVMRDAENRARTAAPQKEPTNIPDVNASGGAKPVQTKAQGKVLGPIESVKIFGSVEFAERRDLAESEQPSEDGVNYKGKTVAEMILSELGPEGDKTEADVILALSNVQRNLRKYGFFLVKILPVDMKLVDSYDKQAKMLSVVVDEGRFGKVNVKFSGVDDEDESDDDLNDGQGNTNAVAKSKWTWFSHEQVVKRFKDLTEGTTFDYARLRRALFDANSHPDLIINTYIDARGQVSGEGKNRRIERYADLELTVFESMPLHMVWEINNYGMEEVEEWQTSLTVQYLNLTKHDDVLTFSPAMSFGGELFSLAGSYMMPHEWWKGGNTTIYGGYSYLDVDNVVPRVDLEGTGWFIGLQHSEALVNSDDHHLALSAGILWRYIEDQYTAYGKYKLNERGASIMPMSLALSYTRKRHDALGGRNFATVQGVLNVASTGDELDEMWTDADERYWILRWQLARLQPLFGWENSATGKDDLHQWMLFMKFEGQYSTDTLIPVEKLSMGGYNCMRGYHSRGYLGDYGVYGTFELRTPILVDAFSAMFGDRRNKTPIDRIQFLGFLDWGWTAFNDLPSGFDDNEFIYSAGFGARLSVTKYTQLKCDVAFPLRDTDWADDDNMEVYFSVQTQF